MLSIITVIFFLLILILVHEFGHFLTAKKFRAYVEEFGIGLPPRIWGKKIGETIYSVNALPIGGFVKISGENREEGIGTKVPESRIFYNLKVWKRFLILAAGVVMNFLFGWLLISLIFFVGSPKGVIITQIQPNTPASQAGLKANDFVLGFNSADELVSFINSHKGKQVELKIQRSGEELSFSMVPRISPPKNEGALGVALSDLGQERLGFFKSIWEGLKASIGIFGMIFAGIFNLLKLAILGRASLEAVAGPVGIVKITAQSSQLGFIYLIQLLALISINLAALNIFPFPALDGGRILFLLIEKIKGKPLPRKFEQYANAVGLALLLILMIVVTIKDVSKLF